MRAAAALIVALAAVGVAACRSPLNADPALAKEKEAFLQEWGTQYGYGGRFDELFDKVCSLCSWRRAPPPAPPPRAPCLAHPPSA
jgi:hypothetical protein